MTKTSSAQQEAASAASELSSITAEIQSLYTKVEQNEQAVRLAQQGTLKYAIRLGELLIQAKNSPLVGHGKWLLWLEENFPGDRTTATRYMLLSANEAHVHHLGSLREALEEIRRIKPPEEPKSTSRPKSVPKPKPVEATIQGKPGLSHDRAVVGWVRARTREGWDRDRLVEASKKNTDGWPRPGKHLTNGGVSECRAAIAAIEQQNDQEPEQDDPPRRKGEPSYAGKAQRKIHAQKRESGWTNTLQMRDRITKALAEVEGYELYDVGLSEEEQEAIATMHEEIVELVRWSMRAKRIVESFMNDLTWQRRYKALRTLADESDKPGERANANAAAEAMLAAKNAKQLGQGA